MKPCPERDVGAPWSLIPAPAADVPRLAGMRSTLAPAPSPRAKRSAAGGRRRPRSNVLAALTAKGAGENRNSGLLTTWWQGNVGLPSRSWLCAVPHVGV